MAPACVRLASPATSASRAVRRELTVRIVPSAATARTAPSVRRRRANVYVPLAGATTNVIGPVISIIMATAADRAATARTMPPAIQSMAAAPVPPAGRADTASRSARRTLLDWIVLTCASATSTIRLPAKQPAVAASASRAGEVPIPPPPQTTTTLTALNSHIAHSSPY